MIARTACTAGAIAMLCGPSAALASGSDTSDVDTLRSMVEDLRRQLEVVPELQRQIDDLQRAAPTTWTDAHRAEALRAAVQDVLIDADQRASFLNSAISAGWDNGFFIASADGNFRLRLGGQLQQRFVYNRQDDSPVDDNRSGFEVRRARLMLSGNIIDPSWTYDIQLAVDRSSGTMQLEDAGWIQKDLGEGFKLRVGQMKAPFMREEMLSSIRMLAVERSLLNAQFTAGLVQGIQLGWEQDQFRAYAMYHDGNRSGNTSWSAENAEFAASARAEWLVSGQWRNFNDYSSFKDEDPGLLIGVAANFAKDEFGTTFSPGPPPTGNDMEVRTIGLTADVTWDIGGASLAAVGVYRNRKTDTGTPADFSRDQLGFLVRGGYFLNNEWELFGQYEWADLDTPGVKDLSVATIGATRYWRKHNLKWQSDMGFSFNELSSAWASDGAGWRADAPDKDGQIVLRTQLQLVF